MKSDNPHAGHERLLTLIDLDELFSSNPDATIINDDTLIDQRILVMVNWVLYRRVNVVIYVVYLSEVQSVLFVVLNVIHSSLTICHMLHG